MDMLETLWFTIQYKLIDKIENILSEVKIITYFFKLNFKKLF